MRPDDQQPDRLDPRREIGQLTDEIPILMLPVRLETRFAPAGDELWVRIYPDDLMLDTFDPVLTEGEVANATVYWGRIWAAAGDEDRERAAWRELVAAHGSGRAGWIVESFVPTDPRPTVAADPPVTPTLPTVPTKEHAWSQPARVTILPQRFVFLGYRGGAAEVVALGRPVPPELVAGPDPAAGPADQLRHDADGNLVVPEPMRWITDFDRAVAVGMGLRIPLTPAQAHGGFDRVLVLGVRLEAPADGQAALERLLDHHSRTRKGLAVLPLGTPTNNTEQVGSGHDRGDDPDASFDRTPRYVPTDDWTVTSDGQWLAEHLGVRRTFFDRIGGADGTDQATGRAMNRALFPATLGYWMQSMLAPIFDADAIEQTRDFLHRHVLASGPVPSIRIGNQPYGILPTTALSRVGWLERLGSGDQGRFSAVSTGRANGSFLRRLYRLLRAVQADWTALVPSVSHVGGAGDPHQALLDIVGLHPGSVEWTQRNAESLQTLYNRLNLQGLGGFMQEIVVAAERVAARQLLLNLGAELGEATPPLLDKVFSGSHNLLTGPVIDDRPLSTTALAGRASQTTPIRAYTDDHRNYLTWLADAARVSHDALYRQDGFTGDTPPRALLYLMLRHALQLGYHEVSVRLHVDTGLYTVEQAGAARSDDPFLHIRTASVVSESRYQPLYTVSPVITGSPTRTVGEYIGASLGGLAVTFDLVDQLAAVDILAGQSTARLERAFADHIDTVSYRLDAWLLGLVNLQVALMRGRPGGPPRTGVHLGAYAWLEDLRPEPARRTPVRLADPELAKIFNDPAQPPLMRDSRNQGYVHAPSLNHAVAAAVLRNGYLSTADKDHRDVLAVNLTSERVRVALGTLEGIRAGQSLGDLLGYQFERGLHDRHALAEVDSFIAKLRKAFPLRADRMASTRTGEGVPIEAIEARNVMDGLAFVEHLKATGQTTYPFGQALPAASPAQAEAMTIEAGRLLDTHDAVADLALAEGVYQAVLGNYDRVASTYDAYAHGKFPPEPDIIRTPTRGTGLRHRLALHLPANPPATSPVAGLTMTPRATAEPAINAFLATTMPAPERIGCVVSFRSAATGASAQVGVTLRDLGLQPADLIAIVRDDAEPAMSELDDRVLAHVWTHHAPRPDAPLVISYLEPGSAPISVFEALPLLRALRRLVTASRPLTASDLSRPNDASTAQDADPAVHTARLAAVVTSLTTLRDDLDTFAGQLGPALADPVANRELLVSTVDIVVAAVTELLARAALHAVPQAGWGFAYAGLRTAYRSILDLVAGVVTRWDDRLTEFADRVAAYAALPAQASDAERFRLLTDAERAISTVPLSPRPATPAAFLAALQASTRPAFAARRQALVDLAGSTSTTVAGLRAEVQALLPLDDFDVTDVSLAGVEDGLITLLADVAAVAGAVRAAAHRRLEAGQDLLTQAATAGSARERADLVVRAARALLGEDFVLVAEFTLAAADAAQVASALTASRSGALFTYLAPDLDFPVDTWLHGLARVREKATAWEQTQLYAGALTGGAEPTLDALQLPSVPGEQWLGLEFPPTQSIDDDRLLYTAHLPPGYDPTQPQCGLLLDEWSELIPGSTVETGLTFHTDRPDNEAPQTMLLVTPSDFRGGWTWDDLVDALHETLDLAKLRAVEPHHVDALPYAWFLPATMMATQARQLTIAADLSLNNKLHLVT